MQEGMMDGFLGMVLQQTANPSLADGWLQMTPMTPKNQSRDFMVILHTCQKSPNKRRLGWLYLFSQLFKSRKMFFKRENRLQIAPPILPETPGKLSGEHLSRSRGKIPKTSVTRKWQKSPNNYNVFPYLSHFTCNSTALSSASASARSSLWQYTEGMSQPCCFTFI